MTRIATLIVNPAAGGVRPLQRQLPALTALLAAHGYQARVRYTTPEPHAGRDLARQCSDSALVLACGGDGTVHDVLQGLAHTGIALGVLPLGTANALARNLHLPLDPLAALSRILTYTPQSIALGELSTAQTTRLFTVMAGCGPDGALAQTMPAGLKRRLGRAAYYAHAAHLFASRRWPVFLAEYRVPGDPGWHRTQAVAMMCSRVADLGGLFSGLTRSSSLHHPTLQLQLIRAPAHLSLPAWFALGRLRLGNPWLTTIGATEMRCTPLDPIPVYAQADAEAAGTLPLHLRILPDSLTLLLPPGSTASGLQSN